MTLWSTSKRLYVNICYTVGAIFLFIVKEVRHQERDMMHVESRNSNFCQETIHDKRQTHELIISGHLGKITVSKHKY